MKAIVVDAPGAPEVLRIEERPIPTPQPGWVLIHIKAFGLNRSELYTRQGHSGAAVQFPRVLGIECVGVVAAAAGSDVAVGQTVAAVMGSMGRAFDGGYAEYALVPAQQVIPLTTTLPWHVLGAIPETFLTAWNSLDALDAQADQTLLIRGGTSALGMATITLAKSRGLTVLATTRNAAKADALRAQGAETVLIDDGQLASMIRTTWPDGIDSVLELVGTITLRDSLHLVRPKGIVCIAGIVGNVWTLADFQPLAEIPSTVRLTSYNSETLTASNATTTLQQIVDGVERGNYKVPLDRVFRFEEIVAAHQYMEENRAQGKLVVVID